MPVSIYRVRFRFKMNEACLRETTTAPNSNSMSFYRTSMLLEALPANAEITVTQYLAIGTDPAAKYKLITVGTTVNYLTSSLKAINQGYKLSLPTFL